MKRAAWTDEVGEFSAETWMKLMKTGLAPLRLVCGRYLPLGQLPNGVWRLRDMKEYLTKKAPAGGYNKDRECLRRLKQSWKLRWGHLL
jgi:hypothetical protein